MFSSIWDALSHRISISGRQYTRFQGLLIILAAVIFPVTPSQAHQCGPTAITMKVGDVLIWQMTADLQEIFTDYTPVSVPDIGVVIMSPDFAFLEHHGVITLVATGIGITNFIWSWFYAETNASGVCALEVTVDGFTNAPITAADAFFSVVSDDPVNTFTGEFLLDAGFDLFLNGPMPLYFKRYYASKLYLRTASGSSMGRQWLHNYQWHLFRFDNRIHIIDSNGRLLEFELDVGQWSQVRNVAVPFQLVEEGSDYVLGDPRSQLFYVFSPDGKLIRIEDGKGNVLSLSYTEDLLGTVSDGLGRELIFTYNASGLLTAVSDGFRSIGLEYNGQNLSIFSDALGGTTSYAYDEDHQIEGLLTAIVLPEGDVRVSMLYDADGRVVEQTDALANTWRFTYESGTTTQMNPLGQTQRHVYSDDGKLLSYEDESARVISLDYDLAGRRYRITDRLGNVSSESYHEASGLPVSRTNAEGNTTLFEYAPWSTRGITFYQVSRVSYPDGTVENYEYDPMMGNLLTWTDESGNITSYSYDALGHVVAISNPLGGIGSWIYDGSGRLTSFQNALGIVTNFSWDPLGRLESILHPDGSTNNFSWDSFDQLLDSTDENGNVVRYSYDGNGRIIQRENQRGNKRGFVYNAQNRLVSIVHPDGGMSILSWDALGRLVQRTDPNGSTQTYGWGPTGKLESVTMPGGATWTQTYNAEGVVSSAQNPTGSSIVFNSNPLGQIIGFQTAEGRATQLIRDARGRMIELRNPHDQVTSYVFENRGLLSQIRLQDGINASYEWNPLRLVTKITDANDQVWTRNYNVQRQLTSIVDPINNAVSFDYDVRGRVSKLNFQGGSVDISYYPDGRESARRYSDGTELVYEYDAEGGLLLANGLSLRYDDSGKVIESNGVIVTRDLGGRIEKVEYRPGKAVTYQYDSDNRLREVRDWLGGITLFEYDAVGRVISTERPNGLSSEYRYDRDGLLVGLDHSSIASIDLELDAAGLIERSVRNLPNSSDAIRNVPNQSFEYNAAGQIQSYSYDSLGRLTSDDVRSYEWNLASHLISYSEILEMVEFSYDDLGKLLTRSSGGLSRAWVWNYALSISSAALALENGEPVEYYIYTPDGHLIYTIGASDDAREFHHYDEMGNTLFITDDVGAVTTTFAYSPHGQLIDSVGDSDTPFTWQGRFGVMREGNTGLYYMRSRWYDSNNGRFLSHDPVNDLHPTKTNPYLYAQNNPLRYIDPVGRQERHWGDPDRDLIHNPYPSSRYPELPPAADRIKFIITKAGTNWWSYWGNFTKDYVVGPNDPDTALAHIGSLLIEPIEPPKGRDLTQDQGFIREVRAVPAVQARETAFQNYAVTEASRKVALGLTSGTITFKPRRPVKANYKWGEFDIAQALHRFSLVGVISWEALEGRIVFSNGRMVGWDIFDLKGLAIGFLDSVFNPFWIQFKWDVTIPDQDIPRSSK